jgi:HAD superfamily hydrolase (TIGR01509 family)
MVMFKDIELIIYDLDGVLIDSNKGIVESFRLLHEEIGEPFNPEDILSRIGVGLYQIFRETLPEKHHDNLEELREIYLRNFRSLGTDFILVLPGVAETLAEMSRRGFKQSVATNKAASEAERILKALNLDMYFDLYAGQGTVEKIKPEPDMILYTLDFFGIASKNAVFVDDTGNGLTAGIKANVNTVGIATGNNTLDQINEVNPSTVIHRISELTEIIK